MFISHKLKKGETFSTVMKKHGVTDWKTTWDLQQNKPLRAKRKHADKVIEGDVVVMIDPKAKLQTLKFLGKTYFVPHEEMDALRAAVTKEIKKKFLPRLASVKAIYDDDYEYMADISTGFIAGWFAEILHTTKRTEPPTKELAESSKALDAVVKAVNAGDFDKMVSTITAADKALKAYVVAAEVYRRKMTDGATTGVKVVKFVDDYAFIVAAALATGGLGPLIAKGAITATQAAAATGAAAAYLKSVASVLGRSAAGEKQSAGQIGYTVVRDTLFGGAVGALGGVLLSGPIGKEVTKQLVREIGKELPGVVARMVHKNALTWVVPKSGVVATLGKDEVARIIVQGIMRTGYGGIMKNLLEYLRAKDGADLLVGAFKSACKGLSGKEPPAKVATAISDKLLDDGLAETLVKRQIKANSAAIQKMLEKAAEEKTAKAA